VLPSHNKGLSNIVLEAMACGLPGLTHALSGHSQVISNGEDRRVVSPARIEQLEDELEKLLADPA
jgi:glycosyltransferase involved in cell wall biosynthesis